MRKIVLVFALIATTQIAEAAEYKHWAIYRQGATRTNELVESRDPSHLLRDGDKAVEWTAVNGDKVVYNYELQPNDTLQHQASVEPKVVHVEEIQRFLDLKADDPAVSDEDYAKVSRAQHVKINAAGNWNTVKDALKAKGVVFTEVEK